MLYRLWMLIVKELLQLARNKLLAPLVLIGPLMEMSLIAWSTSAPIQNLPTAIVDLDRSAESRALLTALENTRTFEFTFYLTNPNEVTPLIEHGKAVAGIIIPAGYSRRLTHPAGDPPQVAFLLDGADPISAREVFNAASGVVEHLNRRLVIDAFGPEAASLSPIQPRLRVRYNEEMKKSVYTVPSELGLMLFAVALMIAGISIARERELGTLEQLMTTPIRRFELVVAKSVPGLSFGVSC